MGSASDWEVMSPACATLEEFGIPYDKKVLSAHRNPGPLADYVKAALLGRPRDRGEVLEALRRVPGAARFFDPANASWAPEQDFWLCAGIGRCPFVMRAEERLPSGEFVFRAVPVTA